MRNKKGISFVEVIITIALLTLAIGGILGVLVQNTSTGQSIDYTYVATNLAKNKIEELREDRRDLGYLAFTRKSESGVSINRQGEADANGGFQRTTIIVANPTIGGTTYPNLTKVTVQVKYKRGGTLMPVSVELVTLLSPYYD